MIRDPHSPDEQLLRAFLRSSRLSAGLKQSELARKLQVPQSFVSKYESGERLLTFLETIAILEILGITVENLLSYIHKQ